MPTQKAVTTLPPRLQRIWSIFQLISLLWGSSQLFLAELTADVKGASKKANIKPPSVKGNWLLKEHVITALLSPYLYSSPTFPAMPHASSSMLPFNTCPCSSGGIKLIKEGISCPKMRLPWQPHSGFLYFSNDDGADRLSHPCVLRTNTQFGQQHHVPQTPPPQQPCSQMGREGRDAREEVGRAMTLSIPILTSKGLAPNNHWDLILVHGNPEGLKHLPSVFQPSGCQAALRVSNASFCTWFPKPQVTVLWRWLKSYKDFVTPLYML